MKTPLLVLTVLVSATTISLAQSLPNYGPNAPATGDSFGKPYSGAKPLHKSSRAYAYHRRAHHRYSHSRQAYE